MASLMRMHIGTKVQALAAALALGATVLGLSAGPAQASPEAQATLTAPCPWTVSDGSVQYFPPGTIVVLIRSGARYKCGKDGQWHQMPPTPSDGGIGDGGVLMP